MNSLIKENEFFIDLPIMNNQMKFDENELIEKIKSVSNNVELTISERFLDIILIFANVGYMYEPFDKVIWLNKEKIQDLTRIGMSINKMRKLLTSEILDWYEKFINVPTEEHLIAFVRESCFVAKQLNSINKNKKDGVTIDELIKI